MTMDTNVVAGESGWRVRESMHQIFHFDVRYLKMLREVKRTVDVERWDLLCSGAAHILKVTTRFALDTSFCELEFKC